MHKDMKITPSSVRFIRLGPNNRWAGSCFEESRIVLSHKEVPHEHANVGNWDAVRTTLESDGSRSKAIVTSIIRELREFYTLGSDCLWVTFVGGKLWWAFAEPDVMPIIGDADRDGARYRRVTGHWQSSDILGRQLSIKRLPSELTKTRRHRQTVCRVSGENYAVRAINGFVA